jgi:hypothetical protein
MEQIWAVELERTMKMQEVLLRSIAKKNFGQEFRSIIASSFPRSSISNGLWINEAIVLRVVKQM